MVLWVDLHMNIYSSNNNTDIEMTNETMSDYNNKHIVFLIIF